MAYSLVRPLNRTALGLVLGFGVLLVGFAVPVAHAQIISQNPQPDLIPPEGGDDFTVETIRPRHPIGEPDSHIKIPRSGALLFAGFDRDQNYLIDRAEAQQGIQTAFARADKNGNGVISLVELESWRIAALGFENASPTNFSFAPNFARTVNTAKFTEVLMRVFDRLDKNEQGEVDGLVAMPDLLKTYTPPRRRRERTQRPDRNQQNERGQRVQFRFSDLSN